MIISYSKSLQSKCVYGKLIKCSRYSGPLHVIVEASYDHKTDHVWRCPYKFPCLEAPQRIMLYLAINVQHFVFNSTYTFITEILAPLGVKVSLQHNDMGCAPG